MKPSTSKVLHFMMGRGWVTSVDIIRNVGTVTPSKRLDELDALGLIEKSPEQTQIGELKHYRLVLA